MCQKRRRRAYALQQEGGKRRREKVGIAVKCRGEGLQIATMYFSLEAKKTFLGGLHDCTVLELSRFAHCPCVTSPAQHMGRVDRVALRRKKRSGKKEEEEGPSLLPSCSVVDLAGCSEGRETAKPPSLLFLKGVLTAQWERTRYNRCHKEKRRVLGEGGGGGSALCQNVTCKHFTYVGCTR